MDWTSLVTGSSGIELAGDEVIITHFGESFDMSDLPEDLSIPQEYRSPEYILDKRLGVESDIWALGCTLFEIRTGRPLFDLPYEDPDEHLVRMVGILGKFPEPWWTSTWEFRGRWFADEMDGQGQPVSQLNNPVPYRSIEEALGVAHNGESNGDGNSGISRKEATLFADLLKKIFRYSPERRLAPEDILQHPWFRI